MPGQRLTVERAGFERMWAALEPVGRHPHTGGYRRYAWTPADAAMREWFVGEAGARHLDLVVDRAGNQWAWWGDPDQAARGGRPGLAMGSHLDSVPDGGAFDGPLGVVSAFLALDALRASGVDPTRPVAVVNFADEEGARFGVACAGSRLITGRLDPQRARGLTDGDGVSLAEAFTAAGHDAGHLGPDPETLQRVGTFVELHIEQGRALVDQERPVAVASTIWPHGRWRLELPGEANHAGTTRLGDRHDPMLALAELIRSARRGASARGALATVGKVLVEPNAVNAIPSRVQAWLDARGQLEEDVRALAAEVAAEAGVNAIEESFTPATELSPALRDHLAAALGDVPVLSTGAGHDAGILASAGVPSALLFVRNPTGISHAPAEHAESDDCLRGAAALADVLADLVSPASPGA